MLQPLLARTGTGVAVATATVVAGIALTTVGWLDDRATREHLLELLRQQAATVRHTIAAAARANRAAAARAESELAARLLDNARLLAEIDGSRGLRPELLTRLTSGHSLFRVTVYGRDGVREQPGADVGGVTGPGQGFGGRVLQRLLADDAEETVTELHQSRWGDARIAAGVRRVSGGAIVLNADASAIAELQRPYSLERLLDEIIAATPELAYITVEQEKDRIARGDVTAGDILAVESPVEVDGARPAVLTLGMRLAGVRDAEREHAVRLAVSFSGLLVLSAAAAGFLWLRGRYGDLRARHDLAHETLRRRERLAAVGELAAMVAHEIRNPLNAIAMSAQRLRREMPAAGAGCVEDRDEWLALLHVIEAEAGRLNGRVQQLLDYSRPPRLARREVRLAALVTELVEAVRPLALERGVDVTADAEGTPAGSVDPAQLRQALENVVRNAIQATPAGGQVRVRAARERRGAIITVQDTGTGIAPAHLPRIFDLYFSTKPDGTGIGLAVAHQVVAAHGGTIDVESEVGRGTRLTIRLPDEEPPDA